MASLFWSLSSHLLVDLPLLHTFIFSMFNNLKSGIPRSVGLSTGIIKIYIWQFYLYSLILLYRHLIAQKQTDCMCYYYWFVFMAWKASVVDLGNKVLKILNGITLLSLLESILYVMCTLFWLVCNSRLVKMTDCTLSNLRYLIFTKSKPLLCCSLSSGWGSSSCLNAWTNLLLFGKFWPCCYLCIDLNTTLKWLVSPHPLQVFP